MGLDLTVQDPACGRDAPMRGSQKTGERLLSLQLKLKRFPLLVLEVSELVPSTSDRLWHHTMEDVGLKSFHLQTVCLLGQGIQCPLFSPRNIFLGAATILAWGTWQLWEHQLWQACAVAL